MADERLMQIVKRNCCDSHFAMALYPRCLSDPDWQRDMAKYRRKGYVVEVVPIGKNMQHEIGCPNEFNRKDDLPKHAAPTLFDQTL